ncbi:MAG: vWA domain-containing protein [Polyangiaceae bacterium]
MSRHRLLGVAAVLGLAVAMVQACGAGGGKVDGETSSSTGNGAGSGVGGQGGSTFTTSSGLGGIDPVGAGGAGGPEECAETSAEATDGVAPADIIIAVDTSGSMSEEAVWTQQNMNAMVTAIVASGIDAHVVMLSSTDICVPAPLGSGSCPNDENLPAYRHVPQPIASTDALEKILATHSQWQPSLRPGATKTIVVISDDDSDLGASAFTSQLLALDPSFAGFKFDAIVSYQDPFACLSACLPNLCQGCGKCCSTCPQPLSAAQGAVYQQLVQQTMGVSGDLCDQNFGPVFQDMATAVVQGASIACVYDIPEPGGGDPIDFTKVNVEYSPGPNQPGQPIYYVPGGAMDCGPQGGWYYDDPQNPSQILLCESTCNAVQGNPDGKISVKFGCETRIGPPR